MVVHSFTNSRGRRVRGARLLPDVEALALGVRVSRAGRRGRGHRRRHRPAHRLDVVLDQRRDLVRLRMG